MSETWDRNKNGDLIPNKGKVILKDKVVEKSIAELEFRLSQFDEEKDNKNIQVTNKAIELLKESLKESTEEHEILFIPLLPCEINALRKGLGVIGNKIQDIEADICSKNCKNPSRSYVEWRDMKDPTLKESIADFILENSIVKRKINEKEEQAFQMLRELV